MADLIDIGIFSTNETNGAIGVGWTLHFYQAGTTTPQNTYPTEADADAGANPNPNPLVSDAEGRFPAAWFNTPYIKAVLASDSGDVLVTKDPIRYGIKTALGSGDPDLGASLISFEGGKTVQDLTSTDVDKGSALITFASDGRIPATVADALGKLYFAEQFGVDPSGFGDQSAALNTALSKAVAADRELIICGTPRVASQVVIPPRARIRFDGSPGNHAGGLPSSYIIKAGSMTVPALLLSGESAQLISGGVIGEGGNTGDNIQITNHSVRWDDGYSSGAGRHGVRIGKDGSGTPNANRFALKNFSSYANGSDGFNIADNLTVGGVPNANAGTLINCFGQSNGGHGLYGGNSFGNTVVGGLWQSNGGRGIYLDPLAMGWLLLGGDSEGNHDNNTGSDLYIEDTDLACTMQDSADTITRAGHGLADGTPIKFARITSTTGITVGPVYYVRSATTNTFQVASSSGGAALPLTNDGTGVFYRVTTHQTRGGHRILGLHVGRIPYDGGFQTDQQWILGQGFGGSSGLRPGCCEVDFTPTLEGSTGLGSVTLSSAVGRAVKVGRMVTAAVNVTVSAFSGATGTLRIGNLPFSAASGMPSSFTPSLLAYLTMAANRTALGGAVVGRFLDLYAYGSAQPFTAVDAAAQTGNFPAAGRISGVITYFTND